jgi:hypothetical protein
MAERLDRRCKYCNTPITMRQMPNGDWLPFQGNKRHYCLGRKAGLSWRAKVRAACAIALLFIVVLWIIAHLI